MKNVRGFMMMTVSLLFLFACFVGPVHALSPAMQKLYQEALAEGGTLVIHDGGEPEEIGPVIKAFETTFPNMKVEAICMPAPNMAPRIITEAAAGKLTVDLARGSVGGYTSDLYQRGLMRSVDLSDVVDVGPQNSAFNKAMWVEETSTIALAYNKNVVPAAEVPKTWEDLLNPKWKGKKIYMSVHGMLGASIFFSRPEGEAIAFLKKLKEQNIVVTPSPTVAVDAVCSGQAYFAEGFGGTIERRMQELGCPIDIAPISPQMQLVEGSYFLKNVKHPVAAKLWVAWRQTPEGKKVSLDLLGAAAETSPDACPSATLLFSKGIKFVSVDSVEKANQRGEYQTKVQEILGMKPN